MNPDINYELLNFVYTVVGCISLVLIVMAFVLSRSDFSDDEKDN